MKYPIKVQARINLTQYEKIRESGMDRSKYIRDAIDFFDCNAKKEVEKSKIKLLDELKKSIMLEDEHVEIFLKEQKIQKENIKKAIDKKYNSCNERLKEIEEEEKQYALMNIKKPERRSHEEIIREILPTLQGFHYSAGGITYEKLSRIGREIKISPEVLRDWVDENKELVKKMEYRERNVIKHEDEGVTAEDKKKEYDDYECIF